MKEKLKIFFTNFKNKIIILSKGEANFNTMLYVWGLIPSLVIMFFLQGKINSIKISFFSIIIYLFLILYFSWHFFVIRKTLKLQPEYKKVKINKKDLYKDKTKEEIEQIKKENRKKTFKKMLLLTPWDTMPMYNIISCLDFLMIITQVQYLLNIIRG